MIRVPSTRPQRPFHQPAGRENARGQVEYTTVKGTLANKTESAVLLDTKPDKPATWVPLRALIAASRLAVYRAERGDNLELQIEVQMALEKGLA